MPKEPITCWSKWNNKTDSFEFNHIENGHAVQSLPVPKSEYQRQSWFGHHWRRDHAYLVDGVVMETGTEPTSEAAAK